MNNNLNKQEGIPNHKNKAIASLILGVISVLPLIALVISSLLAIIVPGFMYYDATRGQSILVLCTVLGFIYFSPIAFLTSISSLILGKMGLKSSKKKFAIIGIIFSIISLISIGVMSFSLVF